MYAQDKRVGQAPQSPLSLLFCLSCLQLHLALSPMGGKIPLPGQIPTAFANRWPNRTRLSAGSPAIHPFMPAEARKCGQAHAETKHTEFYLMRR